MRVILRNGLRDIELVAGPSTSEEAEPIRFDDRDAALAFLTPFLRDPVNESAVRRLLSGEGALAGLTRQKNHDVARQLATSIARGRLKVIVREVDRKPPATIKRVTEGVPPEEPAPAEAPPSQPPPEKTWITIELVDEEGKPVPDEEFWIRTSSGRAITGRLNKEGRAEVRGVEPGTCKVTFPNFDAKDWAAA